jgi:hypothetical protein
MSVLTKNRNAGAKQRALDTKQRALDTASQVVPIAKNASVAARQSAEDAVSWAAPRVNDARTWAAPRVEQAGIVVRDKIGPAISEKIAPAVSSALVEAAHRLDTAPVKRKRWPRVLAGFAIAAAVGSAVAAVVLRRKPDYASFGLEDQAPGATVAPAQSTGNGSAAPSATPEEESVNGRTRNS